VTSRRALVLAGAYVAVLVVANVALALGLQIAVAYGSGGGPDVVTVWRKGALVERRVQAPVGDPKTAFAAQLATPGTTVIVEHVAGEGRVLTLGRRLFSQSFLAGRDGVRATFRGKDVYLTPIDLRQAGLYRGSSPGRWIGPVAGIDDEAVLDRLARDLGCSKEELWQEGRFRRFIVVRTMSANLPDDPDPVVQARRDTSASGARLTVAAEDAAQMVAARVDSKGRLADLLWAPSYDWRAHIAVTRFLAAAGAHFESLTLRGAARRAAWLIQKEATRQCGLDPCIGFGDRIDLDLSAETLIAYSDLARERAGVPFREPANQLAAFVREQQRWDGGFAAVYDRARQRAVREERSDVDALAVLALASAQRVNKNAADRDAAERGLDYLIGRPALLGARDYLNADYRICDAVEQLWERDEDPAGLAFCETWSTWSKLLQLDGTVGEYLGGYQTGEGLVPDVVTTAHRTEGAVATIGAALHAKQKSASLTALDLVVTRGLEFLLREQAPGAHPYARVDPDPNLGAFPVGPGDSSASSEVTAAAGMAILRSLKVLEARGLPSPRKARRQANRINIGDDEGENLPINRGGKAAPP